MNNTSDSQIGPQPQLQHRYQVLRNGDECWVLREALTLEEREEIIARLRKKASADFNHAAALRAELES